MRKSLFIIMLSFLFIGYTSLIFAKENSNNPRSKLRPWSISLCLATTSSGPADDIEKAMIDARFNDTSLATLVDHPFSRTGFGETGTLWTIGFNYIFKAPFGVGIIFSEAPIGASHGHQIPSKYLFVFYSVRTYSPVLFLQAKWLHAGIGPALYYAMSYSGIMRPKKVHTNSTKLGFLIDFGFDFPEKSKFFVAFKAQYRYVGQIEIGPYEEKSIHGIATFPATKVNYNHWLIGVGVGFRF